MIRKTARLATRYNSRFAVLYVQTRRESPDRIPLAHQRYLLNHFKLATELGGEVIQVQGERVTDCIVEVCRERQISTVCLGKPSFRGWWPGGGRYRRLVDELGRLNVDIVILADRQGYEDQD